MTGIYLQYGLRGLAYDPAVEYPGEFLRKRPPLTVLEYGPAADFAELVFRMDSGSVGPEPADSRIIDNVLFAKWEALHCGAVIGRLWFPILRFESAGQAWCGETVRIVLLDDINCNGESAAMPFAAASRAAINQALRAYERGADAEFDLVLDDAMAFNEFRYARAIDRADLPAWLCWDRNNRFYAAGGGG